MHKTDDTLSADGRTYRILELLGRGAHTAAYLAECSCGGLVTKCILKEYVPRAGSDPVRGKARFLAAGRAQNAIRQRALLRNQTPPVCRIFEADGTAYQEIACYHGTTLDRLDLTLPQYTAVCETVARTVGYYHREGFLCLDLKPENLFILQNAPDDTVTQLVEFIDFDSVRDLNQEGNPLISYTRDWAAPEQRIPGGAEKISAAADIYTVGEIVFYLLFGRHSVSAEHRGFSRYPFAECCEAYQKYTERPEIQSLYTRLFRGTLRSSAANRFQDMDEVTALLHALSAAMQQKDYVIPMLPAVSPDFVGRDAELRQIAARLQDSHVLYLTGIGGIGKTTLVKNYIARYRTGYDVIVYLEYDGDFQHTFCDDTQLQISTVTRMDGEPPADYFTRKLTAFRRICGGERTLFVLDNFTGMLTKPLSRLLDCGYDTLIVTRCQPPKNSIPCMELGVIAAPADLHRLIALNLGRTPTKEERLCFDEIIRIVEGHTLVLELIARQIAAGRLDVHTAQALIRAHGFSRFSAEKIGNYKDGEEVYDTLSAIISVLFDAGGMQPAQQRTMQILALLNVRGLESGLLLQFFPEIEMQTLTALAAEGWLSADTRVRLHPVIAETVRGWRWSADDVQVMDYHQKAADIYVGMGNTEQLRVILREADRFRSGHDRHIIRAMYSNLCAWYDDARLAGAYYPETEREAQLLESLCRNMEDAVSELQRSDDSRKAQLLPQYCLSFAGVLLRSAPDEAHFENAAALLNLAEPMIEKGSDNQCYFCMVSAWYYTLAEPDPAKTKALTEQAAEIAKAVFPTDLEIIDIIHIPTANCFFYHNDFRSAARKIEEAVEICKKYPDMIPYIDKQAELLNILLDIDLEMGNFAECRALISEIDRINETYKEQGVCRAVSPDKRAKAAASGS